MKHLYLIGGTMGVGKTAVCQKLKTRLDQSVFLDGDWCWDMHPFIVNDETKTMVMENMAYLLNQFIRCSVFDHVIFCWVIHEQSIIDDLLSRLDTESCMIHAISLTCSPDMLSARLQKDIDAGIRQADVIGRSLPRLPLYEKLNTTKIDTDGLTVEQISDRIIDLAEKENGYGFRF